MAKMMAAQWVPLMAGVLAAESVVTMGPRRVVQKADLLADNSVE